MRASEQKASHKAAITSSCNCSHINEAKIDPGWAAAPETLTDSFTHSPSHPPFSLNFSIQRLYECICFEMLSASSLTSPAAKPTMFCDCCCQGFCCSLLLVRLAQDWSWGAVCCVHVLRKRTGESSFEHMCLFKRKKKRRKYVLGFALLWFPAEAFTVGFKALCESRTYVLIVRPVFYVFRSKNALTDRTWTGPEWKWVW